MSKHPPNRKRKQAPRLNPDEKLSELPEDSIELKPLSSHLHVHPSATTSPMNSTESGALVERSTLALDINSTSRSDTNVSPGLCVQQRETNLISTSNSPTIKSGETSNFNGTTFDGIFSQDTGIVTREDLPGDQKPVLSRIESATKDSTGRACPDVTITPSRAEEIENIKKVKRVGPPPPSDAEWAQFATCYDQLPYGAQKTDYTVEACRLIEQEYWRTIGNGGEPVYGADTTGIL